MDDLKELIRDLNNFFLSYEFFYNFSNISLLKNDKKIIKEKFSEEWIKLLEDSSIGKIKDILLDKGDQNDDVSCSAEEEELKKFVSHRNELMKRIQTQIKSSDGIEKTSLNVNLNKNFDFRGISPKKIHEILTLSRFIYDEKSEWNVIDVGSGLGYVDRILAHHYGYKVVGIESVSSHGESARSKDPSLPVISETVTPDNADSILVKISQSRYFDPINPNLIMGLHSCGDLSPIMLRSFVQSNNLKKIALVSCCYHKMINDPNPLSNFYQNDLKEFSHVYNPYGLRLASQEAGRKWFNNSPEEHENHARFFGYRSLLEASELNYDKKKRVAVRKSALSIPSNKDDVYYFNEYLDNLMTRFNFKSKSDEEVREILTKQYRLYSSDKSFNFLEILTGLQSFIQPLIESLILLDRLLYLQEHNLKNSQIVELFDDEISPRNKIIVAVKS